MKVIFISHANASKTHFHMKGSALGLVLKMRALELGNGLFQVFHHVHWFRETRPGPLELALLYSVESSSILDLSNSLVGSASFCRLARGLFCLPDPHILEKTIGPFTSHLEDCKKRIHLNIKTLS